MKEGADLLTSFKGTGLLVENEEDEEGGVRAVGGIERGVGVSVYTGGLVAGGGSRGGTAVLEGRGRDLI